MTSESLTPTPWKSGGRRLFELVSARVRQFLSAPDADDPSLDPGSTSTRLPGPLPRSVRAVVIGQLVTHSVAMFWGLWTLAQLFGVVLPRFSVKLFSVPMAVIGLLLLALPVCGVVAAVRILRRDARGIKPLGIATACLTAMGAFGTILTLVVMSSNPRTAAIFFTFGWLLKRTIAFVTAIGFGIWTLFVLYRYQRELEPEVLPVPVSQKRQRELLERAGKISWWRRLLRS